MPTSGMKIIKASKSDTCLMWEAFHRTGGWSWGGVIGSEPSGIQHLDLM